MATKIRLQRHGKKRNAYYYIVAIDSRVKRDGKYIERLGDYNPNTNPATINVDFDRALYWVKAGAQPTDTARAILSYKGIMMKNHLDKGVLKGAHTQAQADAKFEKWMTEKASKVESKIEGLKKSKDSEDAKRLAAEKEVNEKRLADIQAKEAEIHAAAEAENAATEEAPTEEAGVVEQVAEAVAETVEAAEEVVEAVAEKVEEVVAEKVEETTATTEEAPANEEEKKED